MLSLDPRERLTMSVLPTLINSSTKLDTTESLSQAEYDENEDGEEDLDNIVKETANEDEDEDDFGDDFDDFEEGDDADDGDFGDFDDGFQAAGVNIVITLQAPSAPIYVRTKHLAYFFR